MAGGVEGMKQRLMVRAVAGVLGVALAGAAAPPKEEPVPGLRSRRGAPTGRALYMVYCARCHGGQGKGDGPAAEALRMRPADLTRLSAAGGGQFPQARIERLLGGIDGLGAHGGKQMPVWGPVFRPVSPADARSAALVERLVQYLETIQTEPGGRR